MKINQIKSQIGIFILVSLIVVVSFTFLISTTSQKKTEVIKNAVNQVDSQKITTQVISIRDIVDSCLKKSLVKATIISGYRGGFIYDSSSPSNYERYISGRGKLNLEYNSTFLRNLDLSQSSLKDRILVYYLDDRYIPLFNDSLKHNSTKVFFPNSIKSNFNDYIFFNFLKCVDLDNLKNNGYNLDYNHFIGKVDSIDTINDLIFFKDLNANINDKVKINIADKIYIGNVESIDKEHNLTKVKFTSGLLVNTNSDIYNEYGININSPSRLNVNFELKRIKVQLDFPITISQNNYTSKFSSLTIDLNVRYVELMKLASTLINYKYKNKSMNFSNIDDIKKVLNDSSIREYNFSKVQIFKTNILDLSNSKKYIYSIIDNSSKLYGNPFIFNFAYQNVAPNMSIIPESQILNSNSLLFISATNTPRNISLQKYVTDPQIYDSYNYFFHEQNYADSSYSYSIDQVGNLSFEGYSIGTYPIKIVLDDHEAVSTKYFVFATGLTENNNNNNLKNCVSFENDGNLDFPVNQSFNNKLFNYIDANGRNIVYGYSLYNKSPETDYSNKFNKSKLKFSQGCIYNTNVYNLTYTIKTLGGTTLESDVNLPSPFELSVPLDSRPLNITFNIVPKASKISVVEPYEVHIYPAECLGPSAVTDSDSLTKYGGDLSCCDLSGINNDIASNSPKALTNSNGNLETSGIPIIANMYFCYDINEFNNTQNYFDYTNYPIWKTLGNDATYLYEGKIKATCSGKYPYAYDNIDSIQGNDNKGMTEQFYLDKIGGGSNISKKIPVSLTKDNIGSGTCNFCYIYNQSSFKLKVNKSNQDWYLASGFISDNTGNIGGYPKAGYSPLVTGKQDFFKDKVLQSGDYYYRPNNMGTRKSDDWTKETSGTFGITTVESIYQGKPYCDLGTDNPYQINDITSKSDAVNSCYDVYLNITSHSLGFKIAPNTWICDYNRVTSFSCSTSPNLNCDDSDFISTITEYKQNIYCNVSVYGCPSTPARVSPDCSSNNQAVPTCTYPNTCDSTTHSCVAPPPPPPPTP